MTDVLVTGNMGFIGHRLVHRLTGEGLAVTATDAAPGNHDPDLKAARRNTIPR